MIRVFFILLLFISCSQQNKQNNTTQATKPKNQDSVVTTNIISETSDLTCPFCGHKTTETLPTEYCLIKFDCKQCSKTIFPKEGDCCVFCSYGSHKCPSMQVD